MYLKSKLILQLVCALSLCNTLNGQIHMEGSVALDLKTGFFKCDLQLSNLPKLKAYRILLNKGMNIKYFKDTRNELIDYVGHYDGSIKGEAVEYTFKADPNEHIPPEFRVNYKGAFPVYVDDFNLFDHKGLIAINDKTLRATEQTKWYPVIYDVKNDKLIHSYTYDLTLSLEGGSTIFINGSAPKKAAKEHFVSNKAHPLLLFAGNYDFVEDKGDYILNTTVTKENAEIIFGNIARIKNNLSKNLGIEFSDNIYLIHHRAINKRKKGSSWGFNTYPSFAFTGLDFKKLADSNGKFYDDYYKYFGHEFGHNYFGSNVMSGKLGWFWLESFAEYLSYNTAEDLSGKQFLSEVLIEQLKHIKEGSFIPLDKIEHKDQIDEKYRYVLAPLMLKCFEDRFGRQKANLTLKYVLDFAKKESLTLEHLERAATKSGISKKQFEVFKTNFIIHTDFKEHIIREIEKKYG